MLFQVLCGFEPIFYTTHPNEESYYCASLYLQDKRTLGVVATSLYTFTGPLGSKYNLICAGVLMSLLPALIVFLLCQKQIYSGITSGAVKG